MATIVLAVDNTVLALSKLGVSSPAVLPMKESVYRGVGFALLLNVTPGASLTVNVQVSNDPLVAQFITNPTAYAGALWNLHDTLQGLNVSKNSSIIYPVYAVRLQTTAYGSGTVTLQIGTLDYQT